MPLESRGRRVPMPRPLAKKSRIGAFFRSSVQSCRAFHTATAAASSS